MFWENQRFLRVQKQGKKWTARKVACKYRSNRAILGVPYPRPKGRGSIEARGYKPYKEALKYYPRPKGRGSIEATGSTPDPLRDTPIHVRKDVAPLKQLY